MAKAKTEKHRWRTENPHAKCPRHPKKDYRLLVEAAWKAGWKCVKKSNYIYCYPPDKSLDKVWVPSTPGSARTLENVKAHFRQNGLSV